MQFRRRSGRKAIAAGDGSPSARLPNPQKTDPLLAALARAFYWRKLIETGSTCLRRGDRCSARRQRLIRQSADATDTAEAGNCASIASGWARARRRTDPCRIRSADVSRVGETISRIVTLAPQSQMAKFRQFIRHFMLMILHDVSKKEAQTASGRGPAAFPSGGHQAGDRRACGRDG